MTRQPKARAAAPPGEGIFFDGGPVDHARRRSPLEVAAHRTSSHARDRPASSLEGCLALPRCQVRLQGDYFLPAPDLAWHLLACRAALVRPRARLDRGTAVPRCAR